MSIIKSLLNGIAGVAEDIVDFFTPDDDKKSTTSSSTGQSTQTTKKNNFSYTDMRSKAATLASLDTTKLGNLPRINPLLNIPTNTNRPNIFENTTSGQKGGIDETRYFNNETTTPTYQDSVNRSSKSTKSVGLASDLSSKAKSVVQNTSKQFGDAFLAGLAGKKYESPVDKSTRDAVAKFKTTGESVAPYSNEYLAKQSALAFPGDSKYNKNEETDNKAIVDNETTKKALFKGLETYGLLKELEYDNSLTGKFLFNTPKYKINELYEKNKQNDIKNQIITNQKDINDLYYYDHPLSYNGCSMIAVNNALKLMGRETSMAEIIKTFQEKEGAVGNNALSGALGSNPFTLTKVFDKYDIGYERVTSNDLEKDGIYIIAYWNSMDYTSSAHFVAIKVQNGYPTTYNRGSGTDFKKPAEYLKKHLYITGYRLKTK